jgi:hypothetical protein
VELLCASLSGGCGFSFNNHREGTAAAVVCVVIVCCRVINVGTSSHAGREVDFNHWYLSRAARIVDSITVGAVALMGAVRGRWFWRRVQDVVVINVSSVADTASRVGNRWPQVRRAGDHRRLGIAIREHGLLRRLLACSESRCR